MVTTTSSYTFHIWMRAFAHRFMLILTVIYFFPSTFSDTGTWIISDYILTPLMMKLSSLAVFFGGERFSIDYSGNSHSGDTLFDYFYLFSSIVLALVLAFIWCLFNTQRNNRINWWWSNILRICLANTMLFYGIAKAIPVQMQAPDSVMSLFHVYELTPMDHLWFAIGVSPAFEIFTGLVEVIGGIFLLIPRLIIPGELINLISIGMIVLYNYCYDVPVKIMASWLFITEFILIFPFLKDFISYLLGKKDLLQKTRQRIISLHSLSWRRLIITAYLLVSIIQSILLLKPIIDGYRMIRHNNDYKSALTATWNITSAKYIRQDMPRLKTTTWHIIAIKVFDAKIAEIGIFSDMAMIFGGDALLNEQKNEINLSSSRQKKVFLHYELTSAYTAVFTIYSPNDRTPIAIFHAQKYNLPHHPAIQFHWVSQESNSHV